MRPSVKEMVEICIATLPLAEPVYEFGSYLVIFAGKNFIGSDMREGPGVDVVLDLHNIDLPSESVGSVLLLDTVEHVEYVREAMDEVWRILKPGGILIMSSVMDFPIHGYPNDYWRFTPEAFKSLLSGFSTSYVYSLGRPWFPHTVLGVACKGDLEKEKGGFSERMEAWKKRWQWRIFYDWKEFIRLVMPPILMEVYIQFAVKWTNKNE